MARARALAGRGRRTARIAREGFVGAEALLEADRRPAAYLRATEPRLLPHLTLVARVPVFVDSPSMRKRSAISRSAAR